jgi:hypothetical protein
MEAEAERRREPAMRDEDGRPRPQTALQNTAAVHYTVMSTTIDVEPGWKTYLKSIIFVSPAVAAMWFACLNLLPKLEEIWAQAGYYDVTARGIIAVFVGWTEHISIIAITLGVFLIVLEWGSPAWRRHRRMVVGVAVFLVNAAVLFFMTSMLLYALEAVVPLLRK